MIAVSDNNILISDINKQV